MEVNQKILLNVREFLHFQVRRIETKRFLCRGIVFVLTRERTNAENIRETVVPLTTSVHSLLLPLHYKKCDYRCQGCQPWGAEARTIADHLSYYISSSRLTPRDGILSSINLCPFISTLFLGLYYGYFSFLLNLHFHKSCKTFYSNFLLIHWLAKFGCSRNKYLSFSEI